jgi:mono/diheme cytochrome c family protein
MSFVVFAVILVVASCTKKSAPTTAKDVAVNAARIFGNNCGGCHGPTGTEGRAPNLSKVHGAKADIVRIITKGEGHMPAFEDKLNAKEIEAVADFVLALKK